MSELEKCVGATVTVHGWPYTGWDGRTGVVSQILCTGMRLVRFDDHAPCTAGLAPEYLEPSGTAQYLRVKLQASGISASQIASAWPDWWADECEASASARLELRFEIARKLHINPQCLAMENDRIKRL